MTHYFCSNYFSPPLYFVRRVQKLRKKYFSWIKQKRDSFLDLKTTSTVCWTFTSFWSFSVSSSLSDSMSISMVWAAAFAASCLAWAKIRAPTSFGWHNGGRLAANKEFSPQIIISKVQWIPSYHSEKTPPTECRNAPYYCHFVKIHRKKIFQT